MSPYQFWAVFLAAIGWFSVGILVAQRARIGITGKIEMPTCYKTNPGTDRPLIDWRKEERSPYPMWLIAILAILSLAPLVISNINWSWVILLILIVLTLLILFAWMMTAMGRDAVYLVEDTRELVDDNKINIHYKHESPLPKKRDVVILIIVAMAWLLVFFGITRVVMDNAVRTGVLLAGFILMVALMYVKERNEEENRRGILGDNNYCKRCSGKLHSKMEPRVIRENSHQHGGHIYYTERTEYKVVMTCKICGMVTGL